MTIQIETSIRVTTLSGVDFKKKIHEQSSNNDLKLFAVVLGGRAPKCNTELHDVIFTVGTSICERISDIKEKWFGLQQGLHIDAYAHLDNVGGYKIVISTEKSEPVKKLFFLNFGGYSSSYFGEVHENGFYIGEDAAEAKRQAALKLCKELEKQHCDDNLCIQNKVNQTKELEMDDVIEISKIDQYFINLAPATEKSEIKAFAGYGSL